MANGPLNICIAGAAPDTGNLGVSALLQSTLSGLVDRIEHLHVTVLDHGRGLRQKQLSIGEATIKVDLLGIVNTRRLHRAESLMQIHAASMVGCRRHPTLERLHEAHAVLDISGGDSLTDMYGRHRFRTVSLIKQIVLRLGTPLILLPQTYGPLRGRRSRRTARRLVTRATAAWARDPRSFEQLTHLLGGEFRPTRHRLGVDVAFRLPAKRPADVSLNAASQWLAADDDRPRVAINVSGLLYNRGNASQLRTRFRADYRLVVRDLTHRILKTTAARVLLVPHVVTTTDHPESDVAACKATYDALDASVRNRVSILPPLHDPCELKWVVTQADWLCGGRMHATIAALSSGVPAAATAYSGKFRGIFDSCGQARSAVDLRRVRTIDAVRSLMKSFEQRAALRASLAEALPPLRSLWNRQMDDIASLCHAVSDSSPQQLNGNTYRRAA